MQSTLRSAAAEDGGGALPAAEVPQGRPIIAHRFQRWVVRKTPAPVPSGTKETPRPSSSPRCPRSSEVFTTISIFKTPLFLSPPPPISGQSCALTALSSVSCELKPPRVFSGFRLPVTAHPGAMPDGSRQLSETTLPDGDFRTPPTPAGWQHSDRIRKRSGPRSGQLLTFMASTVEYVLVAGARRPAGFSNPSPPSLPRRRRCGCSPPSVARPP